MPRSVAIRGSIRQKFHGHKIRVADGYREAAVVGGDPGYAPSAVSVRARGDRRPGFVAVGGKQVQVHKRAGYRFAQFAAHNPSYRNAFLEVGGEFGRNNVPRPFDLLHGVSVLQDG